jgi:hypothetical protein
MCWSGEGGGEGHESGDSDWEDHDSCWCVGMCHFVCLRGLIREDVLSGLCVEVMNSCRIRMWTAVVAKKGMDFIHGRGGSVRKAYS